MFYDAKCIGSTRWQWRSLDVVAHEFGHAIDITTPGGLSQGGTKEFIADVFGTATEWFANEPAPFDTPDYVWGDRVNIARRHMFDPSHFEGPRCFNSSVPGIERTSAASVIIGSICWPRAATRATVSRTARPATTRR